MVCIQFTIIYELSLVKVLGYQHNLSLADSWLRIIINVEMIKDKV